MRLKLSSISMPCIRNYILLLAVCLKLVTSEETESHKSEGDFCNYYDENWYPDKDSLHHYLICKNGKFIRERCATLMVEGSDGPVVKIFEALTQQCYMPPAKIQRQAYVAGSARVGDRCVQNTDCLRGAYCSSGTCTCLSDFVSKDFYCYSKINPSQSGCQYNEQCNSVWPGALCNTAASNGQCQCPNNIRAAETRDGFVCVDDSTTGVSKCPTPIGAGEQTVLAGVTCTVGANPGSGACAFNSADISDMYDCIPDQPGTGGVCCPSRALACIQPQVASSGGGGQTRYYYNSVTGTCEQFYWVSTSTNNNANNFETNDHCESYCKTTCPRGAPQYTSTGTLNRNRPLTCQGTFTTCNSNFECIGIGSTSYCCPDVDFVCSVNGGKNYGGIPTAFDAGFPIASQARLRWYYDVVQRACITFQYQGGGGNFNNFGTQQDCDNYCQRLLCDRGTPIRDNSGVGYQSCSSSSGCPSSHLCTNNVCCPSVQTVCAEPLQLGTCQAYVTRYWYNAITRDCEPFTYSGCQGNDNNFESLLACQNYCRNTNAEPRCIQGQAFKDGTGNFLQCSSSGGFGVATCPLNYDCYFDGYRYGCCPTKSYTCSLSAAIGVTCGPQSTRWYYDTTSQTCQTVQYLGCDGNSNNFPTREMCESYCAVGGCPSGGQPYRDGTNAVVICSAGVPCPSGYECNTVAVGTSSIQRCCPTKANICSLPPNSALSGISINTACSNTQIARYYFNRATSSCTTFTFNGCSSNGNNFATLAQCQNYCNSAACEAGEAVYVDPNSQRPLTCNSFLSNSNVNQCPTGYTCRNDRLNGNQNVCCGATDMGVCPAGEKAFVDALTLSARECLPNIAASCPNNFLCRFNSNTNKYYCCASSSGSICPTGKAPYYTTGSTTPTVCTLGNVINACTNGYSCQSAVTGGFQGYCCSINPICLNAANYYVDAQTNLPRSCIVQNFNSFNGCPTGYSCQANSIGGLQQSTSGFCCQGGSSPGSVCGVNQQPYLLNNQPQQCFPNQGNQCPFGFTCTATPGTNIFYCCQQSQSSAVCGTRQPYLINNQPQQCFPNSGSQCPFGYACTQSPGSNIFYCCQQSQTGGSCPGGLQTEILNGQPRTCSIQFAQCSPGYSCQYISTLNTYQCCGQGSTTALDGCPPGYSASTIAGTSQVQSCQIGQFNQCLQGYTCQYSTTRSQFQCCGFRGGCPQGAVASMNSQNGQAQGCIVGQFGVCPSGYNCVQGINGAGVCCTGGVNVPTTALPGQSCSSLQSCTGGSVCINSICQCQTGILQGNTCVASAVLPIGSVCSFGQQCAGGSQCINSRCQCSVGQIVQNNQCINQVNPNPGGAVCPINSVVNYVNSSPQICLTSCTSAGYTCTYSFSLRQSYCCSTNQGPSPTACIGTCVNSGQCQAGYTCRFNQLTNSNQCCPAGGTTNTGTNGCPRGSAYLYPGSNTALSCPGPGSVNRCPGGYFCVFSSISRAYQCCSQQRAQRHQTSSPEDKDVLDVEEGGESRESLIDLTHIDINPPPPGSSIQNMVVYPKGANTSKWNQIVYPPHPSRNITPIRPPVIVGRGGRPASNHINPRPTTRTYIPKKSLGKSCELDDDCFFRCSRFRNTRVCMCPRHQVLDTSIKPPQCRSSCRNGYMMERGVCLPEVEDTIFDQDTIFGDTNM